MQSTQPPLSTAPATPSKIPLNGLFRNGVWHCNCSPRLPAIQFTVKRDTPNRGRTFYTCQLKLGKENKCDFFLWSEEARAREVGAVLSNSRTEAETPSRRKFKQVTLHESITPRKEKRHWTEKTPISGAAEMAGFGIARADTGGTTRSSSTLKESTTATTGAEDIYGNGSSSESEDEVARLIDASSQTSTGEPKLPAAGSKRKRPDEDEYSDFSSADEEELVTLTDRSSKGRYHDALVTPADATRTTTLEDGLPTPFTERPVRRVLFALPEDGNSAKRQRTDNETVSAAHHGHRPPPSNSPPPSSSSSSSSSSFSASQQQHQHHHAAASPPTPGAEASSLTSEVMGLLRDQKVDEPALRAVRAALDRHAARARGLERGRDASRDAIRRAEGCAAKLQHRIAELMKIYRDS